MTPTRVYGCAWLQAGGFEDDDADSYRYLTQAFARMAEALGDDFAPYLPLVLPPILEQAVAEARLGKTTGAHRLPVCLVCVVACSSLSVVLVLCREPCVQHMGIVCVCVPLATRA